MAKFNNSTFSRQEAIRQYLTMVFSQEKYKPKKEDSIDKIVETEDPIKNNILSKPLALLQTKQVYLQKICEEIGNEYGIIASDAWDREYEAQKSKHLPEGLMCNTSYEIANSFLKNMYERLKNVKDKL